MEWIRAEAQDHRTQQSDLTLSDSLHHRFAWSSWQDVQQQPVGQPRCRAVNDLCARRSKPNAVHVAHGLLRVGLLCSLQDLPLASGTDAGYQELQLKQGMVGFGDNKHHDTMMAALGSSELLAHKFLSTMWPWPWKYV